MMEAMAGEREVELPGGRTLRVRPATVDDIDGLVALYKGLDDEARHRRFFSIFHPPRSYFEKLVAAPERGGLDLVAEVQEPDGAQRIVAEAGYEALDDGDGELAITVDKSWRGWLGPYLLDALLEAAADQGKPNLEADVLCSNLSMLTLLRCRGYALMPRDDWTVVRLLVKAGAKGTPSWPGEHDEPHLLVEGAGGNWRGVVKAEEAGVEILGCPGPTSDHTDCPVLRGEPCPLVEGADAILVHHAPDTPRWDELRAAHQRLHPEVPVLVDLCPDDQARPGEVDVSDETPTEVLTTMAREVRERRR